MSNLPVFEKIRGPARFRIVATFFASLLVAYTWKDLLSAHLKKNIIFKIVVGVLSLHFTLDLVYLNRRLYKDIFVLDNPKPKMDFLAGSNTMTWDYTSDPYDNKCPMYRGLLDNRSMLNCYEPFETKKSIDIKRHPLVFTDDKKDLKEIQFSPHQVTAFLNNKEGQQHRVYFNQNYIRGWTSDEGEIKFSEAGLGFVETNKDRIDFRFYPPGLNLGIFIFFLTLGVSGSFRFRKKF